MPGFSSDPGATSGGGGGGGGGEDLAATLALGNTTGGSDISLTSGDDITFPAGAVDLRLLRSAASNLTVDNGAGGNARLDVANQGLAGTLFKGTGQITGGSNTLSSDCGLTRQTAGVMSFTNGSTGEIAAIRAAHFVLSRLNPDVGIERNAAGILEVTDGSTGQGAIRALRDTEDHTGDDTLTEVETGKLHTNDGAAGVVTLTLPTGAAVGTQYGFCRVATFAFRVDPAVTERILYSGGLMALGEFLELAADGSAMELVKITSTIWKTMSEVGTLVEETP